MKELFVKSLIDLHVAVFLYKVVVDDFGDGRGIITATNDKRGMFKAFYDDGEFTEWEVRMPCKI